MNGRLGPGPTGLGRPKSGKMVQQHEMKLMQGNIEMLQQQLVLSRNEIHKVTEQLNCLILLVKKAWTGDRQAAVHVANIVGVAPPDFAEEESSNLTVTLTAKPKSRALNNWALMTISILNREYSRVEREMAFQQRAHLQTRKEYLEEQLTYHRDIQARQYAAVPRKNSLEDVEEEDEDDMWYRQNGDIRTFMTQNNHNGPPSRPVSGKQIYGKISVDRPPSGVNSRRPGSKQLYRKTAASTSGNNTSDVDVTWADLIVEPSTTQSRVAKESDKVFDGLCRLGVTQTDGDSVGEDGQQQQQQGDDEDEDRMHMPYNHPSRYITYGLFDAGSALGPPPGNDRSSRPMSAVKQNASDAMRARPKSAVLAKGERYLKYETTKPVSAKSKRIKSATARLEGGNDKDNHIKPAAAKNAGLKNPRLNLLREHADQAESRDIERQANSHRDRFGANSSLFAEDPELEHDYQQMKVRIKKPESVVKFEEDLLSMNDMEHDFRKATQALQKKLGISTDGMI